MPATKNESTNTTKTITNCFHLVLVIAILLFGSMIVTNIADETGMLTYILPVSLLVLTVITLVFSLSKKYNYDSSGYISKLSKLNLVIFTFASIPSMILTFYLFKSATSSTDDMLNMCEKIIDTVTPLTVCFFISVLMNYLIIQKNKYSKFVKSLISALSILANTMLFNVSASMFLAGKDSLTFIEWIKIIISSKGNDAKYNVIFSNQTIPKLIFSSVSVYGIVFSVILVAVMFFISKLTDDTIQLSNPSNNNQTISDTRKVINKILSYESTIDKNSTEYNNLNSLNRNIVNLLYNIVISYRNLPRYSSCPYCNKTVSTYKVIFEDNKEKIFKVSSEYVLTDVYNILSEKMKLTGANIDINKIKITAVKPHAKIEYFGHEVPPTAFLCPHCITTIPKQLVSISPPLTNCWLFGLPQSGKSTFLCSIYDLYRNCCYSGSPEYEFFQSIVESLKRGVILDATIGLKQSPLLIVNPVDNLYVSFRDCSGELAQLNRYSTTPRDVAIFVIDPDNLDESLTYVMNMLRDMHDAHRRKYNRGVLLFTKIDKMPDDIMRYLNENHNDKDTIEHFKDKYKDNKKFINITKSMKEMFRSFSITGISVGSVEEERSEIRFVYKPQCIEKFINCCIPNRW